MFKRNYSRIFTVMLISLCLLATNSCFAFADDLATPISANSLDNAPIATLSGDIQSFEKETPPVLPEVSAPQGKPHEKKEKHGDPVLSITPIEGQSLTVANTATNSISINAIYPVDGAEGNYLFYYDYRLGTWIDISKTKYTRNNTYTVSNLSPLQTYYFWSCWYTYTNGQWVRSELSTFGTTTPSYVNTLEMTIFAASDGICSGLIDQNYGHSWITLKNISPNPIQIGLLYPIQPGKTISLGTWGNQTETVNAKGIWYNLEAYGLNKNWSFGKAYLLTDEVPLSKLNSINSYITFNDNWSEQLNCAYFSTSLWNIGSSRSITGSIAGQYSPALVKASIDDYPDFYATSTPYVPYDYIPMYAIGSSTPVFSVTYK